MQMEKNDEQKHFVLVHGAGHGAWCWYKVENLLTSLGHKVTSLDLAASGINPKQVDDLQSIANYYEPLMVFMASLPKDEKVILVGHSYNGLSTSVAMERFPEKVSVAVFISATMPSPTNSFVDILKEYDTRQTKANMNSQYDVRQVKGSTQIIPKPEKLAKQYQKSPPEDLILATKLVRPIGLFGIADLLKEATVSDEKYGSVSRVFILCDEEDDIKAIFRWMIAQNPPDEVKEIPGSDHMVMISKPQELCAYLQEIAHRYS
ncbi:salicylic acid-binding protein 2-like [Macadamia integrifolia]|uniref:salicylic acid-binding protein 2-like n=1 Tax=Macadamia integrifolia TaxID=60698 RepID=UPI001C4EA4E4|nr:salicylic acid-binding protein 2-like [Macadamia integrifolia]